MCRSSRPSLLRTRPSLPKSRPDRQSTSSSRPSLSGLSWLSFDFGQVDQVSGRETRVGSPIPVRYICTWYVAFCTLLESCKFILFISCLYIENKKKDLNLISLSYCYSSVVGSEICLLVLACCRIFRENIIQRKWGKNDGFCHHGFKILCLSFSASYFSPEMGKVISTTPLSVELFFLIAELQIF